MGCRKPNRKSRLTSLTFPMTPEDEAIQQLDALKAGKTAHIDADEILLRFLEAQGYPDMRPQMGQGVGALSAFSWRSDRNEPASGFRGSAHWGSRRRFDRAALRQDLPYRVHGHIGTVLVRWVRISRKHEPLS